MNFADSHDRVGKAMDQALRGDDDTGDGSQQSGYAAPEFGPFECDNCIHFEQPNRCNHPQVISDPEVKGQVDPEGCCNLFKSAHKETQEEEHSEGGAARG